MYILYLADFSVLVSSNNWDVFIRVPSIYTRSYFLSCHGNVPLSCVSLWSVLTLGTLCSGVTVSKCSDSWIMQQLSTLCPHLYIIHESFILCMHMSQTAIKFYFSGICIIRRQKDISQRFSMFALGRLCLTCLKSNILNQHQHQTWKDLINTKSELISSSKGCEPHHLSYTQSKHL